MDNQWLKAQFQRNPHKTKTGLAQFLSLEPPAISKILSGSRQIKAQEYNLMRQYFGLPVDGEGATQPNSGYQLEQLAGGNSFEDSADSSQDNWVIPAGILNKRTQASPDKIKIFTVQETLMEPDYKRDENVLVDLSDATPSPAGPFIVSDGFGYMLRLCEFIPNSDPPNVKISAISNGFQSQTLNLEDIHIVGRVIAKLQWL